MLFIIYIADLLEQFEKKGIKSGCFVDDLRAIVTIEELSETLDIANNWA